MAEINIVKITELTDDIRIDSQYFSPKYVESENILLKKQHDNLINLADVSDGNHNTIAEKYNDTGVRYIRGKDVIGRFIDTSEQVLISDDTYNSIKRAHVRKNDILLSIVGTIGSVALVTEYKNKLACSCKLAIVRTRDISPEFLYVYFLTKFGQAQIKRMTRGAVQQGLILPDLRNLLIVIPSEKLETSIQNKVQTSYQKNEKSEKLLKEVNDELSEYLDMSSVLKDNSIQSIVDLKLITDFGRIDAEYYQPKYEKLLKQIVNYKDGYCKLLI